MNGFYGECLRLEIFGQSHAESVGMTLEGVPAGARVDFDALLRFMQRRNITIPLKDTTDPENREELIRIGGKGQVPCLVIDGKALYESMDIIAWLDQNMA